MRTRFNQKLQNAVCVSLSTMVKFTRPPNLRSLRVLADAVPDQAEPLAPRAADAARA